MFRIFFSLAFATLSYSVARAQIERPRLVVGIVVDQMKQEYLDRFYDKFGEDGFRRILGEGFACRNTHYPYVPTETGPGHATISTGAMPAVHGIVGNAWFDRKTGQMINCVNGDPYAAPVGTDSITGQVSARRLLATTISDELKLFTQERAKVVTVGIKDRAAALTAGHMADGAYWLDLNQGHFVSSDYYVDSLPAWVNTFNQAGRAEAFNQETWTTLFPVESYTEAGPDDSPHEHVFRGKKTATFPYDLKAMTAGLEALRFRYLPYLPYGNTMVREMAQAAVLGEGLGQDEIPDMLGVNFSSVDYLGHLFGPNSVEMADMIVRLDREVAELLQFLDAQVGPGQYLVFLTADHGVSQTPRFLQERQMPAGSLPPAGIQALLNQKLKTTYKQDDLVVSSSIYDVYLDRERIAEAKLSLPEVQRSVVDYLRQVEGLVTGYTAEDLMVNNYSEGLAAFVQRGFLYERSPDVIMMPRSGWLAVTGPTRTSHGTPYTYDTHVPLLWYGWGIRQGESVKPHWITHIAPTVSHLLRIPMPSGSGIELVEELFEK